MIKKIILSAIVMILSFFLFGVSVSILNGYCFIDKPFGMKIFFYEQGIGIVLFFIFLSFWVKNRYKSIKNIVIISILVGLGVALIVYPVDAILFSGR